MSDVSDSRSRCAKFCQKNVSQRRALCGFIITVAVVGFMVIMMILLRFWENEARRSLQYGLCSAHECSAPKDLVTGADANGNNQKNSHIGLVGTQDCCCRVLFESSLNTSYRFNGTICGSDVGKPVIPENDAVALSDGECASMAYRPQPCWFDTVDLMVWNGRPSALVLRVVGFAYLGGFATCLIVISVWIVAFNGCNPVSNENLPFKERSGFSLIESGDEDLLAHQQSPAPVCKHCGDRRAVTSQPLPPDEITDEDGESRRRRDDTYEYVGDSQTSSLLAHGRRFGAVATPPPRKSRASMEEEDASRDYYAPTSSSLPAQPHSSILRRSEASFKNNVVVGTVNDDEDDSDFEFTAAAY
jgi:hypothetical protein